jgi:glycine C-acetyltransferase
MSNQKNTFYSGLQQTLDQLREQGLYKPERVLASRQGAEVMSEDGRTLINMCANNYLGLSGQEWVAQASIDATEKYGYGLSSVRFICGTQTVHKQLEQAISNSSAPRTPSCTRRPSTPTAACSNRCSTRTTPSSPMR